MVGTSPYLVVALRRRSGRPRRCAVRPCTLLRRPRAVGRPRARCCVGRVRSVRAFVPSVLLSLLRAVCRCLRACCSDVRALAARARCCVGRVRPFGACVLLRRPRAVRPCLRAFGAAVSAACGLPVRAAAPAVRCPSVPTVRSAASNARGPFPQSRTFIPRRWETMVGTSPYLVVALRRRSGRPRRCAVRPCTLLRRPRAVCLCVRAAVSAACRLSVPACVLLRRPCAVGTLLRLPRACCCVGLVRSVRAFVPSVLRSLLRAVCRCLRACCCDVRACALLRRPGAVRPCLRAFGAAVSAACGLSVPACVLLRRPCADCPCTLLRAAASAACGPPVPSCLRCCCPCYVRPAGACS